MTPEGTIPFVFYLQIEKKSFNVARVTNYILFTVSHGYKNISDSSACREGTTVTLLYTIHLLWLKFCKKKIYKKSKLD